MEKENLQNKSDKKFYDQLLDVSGNFLAPDEDKLGLIFENQSGSKKVMVEKHELKKYS